MIKKIILGVIWFYQKMISPVLKTVFFSSCRFSPSCSQYTYQTVSKYGTIRGLILGIRQMFKCHPFS
jgi:putative membrane protein insertion efficiency factor